MFAPRVLIYEQDAYVQTTVAMHKVGQIAETLDGRVFRYAKAGASNLGAGKLGTAPAQKTNHHNIALATAVKIGDTQVTVTLGATAAVANEYAGGLLTVNAGTGVPIAYEISSHPAAGSGASLTVNLVRPAVAALATADTKLDLVHNVWNGTIEGTVQTRRAAGVPMIAVTAGNYYWAQTKGVAPVLSDGAVGLGNWMVPSGSVSGALAAISTTIATAEATNLLAKATVMATVDTEYRPVELFID